MLRIHRIFLTLVLLLTAIPVVHLSAWKGVGAIIPMIERVTPGEAVPGDIVTVTGFQLDSKHVRELYLSETEAGSELGSYLHYRVDIVTQSELEIRFRVPEKLPPGDMCIAIKLVGQTELIEQPVFLKILEPAGRG